MKYQARPVIVDAFKIVSITSMVGGNGTLVVVTDDGAYRKADAPMLARYNPVPGDYWVIQSDGYEYLNPAEVFERKYIDLDLVAVM